MLVHPLLLQLDASETEAGLLRKQLALARGAADRVLQSGLEEALAALGCSVDRVRAPSGSRGVQRVSKAR